MEITVATTAMTRQPMKPAMSRTYSEPLTRLGIAIPPERIPVADWPAGASLKTIWRPIGRGSSAGSAGTRSHPHRSSATAPRTGARLEPSLLGNRVSTVDHEALARQV